MTFHVLNRRHLLSGVALTTLCATGVEKSWAASTRLPLKAAPVPLSDVRLLPSPYKTAVDVNLTYLLFLSPDRLLHNFRKGAGLTPKGEVYGGWEQDTIAGHSLGHYLSAIALMHAQTGNAEMKNKAAYIVEELITIQKAQGDGYVAGFTRKRPDGSIVDGKEIFPEIMKGDIRSAGFDLNGCWVPFYNWHKLYTGLFDVQTWCGNDRALKVAVDLGHYIEKVFAALNDEQVQKVLDCEHGGLNESFAELFARTKDVRWLKLSERIYHHRVMNPMEKGEDRLANIHSNTNIPKIIGLARLYEVSAEPKYAKISDFFWHTVTEHHSFVIGGNGDREYFFERDAISKHITEATCEHCASYNMMKLTRFLFAWHPDASYFDYYERTHLNHVMAQQNPRTGMFTYMTPLFTGAAREFSDPENNFTCCHGTGMESHAKHGDSIYWQGPKTLFVNLYIPSTVHWKEGGADLRMETEYPYKGDIALTIEKIQRPRRATIALRVPGWAKSATVTVNGKPVKAEHNHGYLVLNRVWTAKDKIALTLSLDMRVEATNDNDHVVALLRGPMVLAADLGGVDKPFNSTEPALVGADIVDGIAAVNPSQGKFVTRGIGRPGELDLVPFYSQYERRSAIYFKRFTDAEWKTEEAAFIAEQTRLRDLAARSVDVMHLGEMQAERDHNLQADISWPGTYRGRNGREARAGGYMSFKLKVTRDGAKPGPRVLQATYWGDDKCDYDILIDGEKIATVQHNAPKPGVFFDEEYPIPQDVLSGKNEVTVRLQPKGLRAGTGMIFGFLLFTAAEKNNRSTEE